MILTYRVVCPDGKTRDPRRASKKYAIEQAAKLHVCEPGCPGGVHRARSAPMSFAALHRYFLALTRAPWSAWWDNAQSAGWKEWLRAPDRLRHAFSAWEWVCPDGKRRLGKVPGESFEEALKRVFPQHGTCPMGSHSLQLRRSP